MTTSVLFEKPPTLPKPIRLAMAIVIDYLWENERSNFQRFAATNASAHVGDHVFVALCFLRTWLEARHHDPQHYLTEEASS